jgi:Na+-transporting methylmalonyl-CoA/oxaloacetate decarboxylase beta subunit
MESALVNGIQGLFLGVMNIGIGQVIMIAAACVLLYLGIKKGYEPLLLVPIGFGAILVNIPEANMMAEGGFLRFFYDAGVRTEIFPLLIFIGIGAMTDFQPLLQNPKIILLGAAGQFGIFITLLLALALGFDKLDAVAVAVIGACDGPTAIYVSSKPDLENHQDCLPHRGDDLRVDPRAQRRALDRHGHARQLAARMRRGGTLKERFGK